MPEPGNALAKALNLLSRRDHSEMELRRKLSAKGFPDAVLDETITRLRGLGYLNDSRFARNYAESSIRNGKGYGFRLRFELSRRGIPEQIIEETLAMLGTEYDEVATLTNLMAQKFGDFDPIRADARLKRRVISYFQRRGFSLAAIVRVFRDSGE